MHKKQGNQKNIISFKKTYNCWSIFSHEYNFQSLFVIIFGEAPTIINAVYGESKRTEMKLLCLKKTKVEHCKDLNVRIKKTINWECFLSFEAPWTTYNLLEPLVMVIKTITHWNISKLPLYVLQDHDCSRSINRFQDIMPFNCFKHKISLIYSTATQSL